MNISDLTWDVKIFNEKCLQNAIFIVAIVCIHFTSLNARKTLVAWKTILFVILLQHEMSGGGSLT
jgi:hypothetical protein